MERATSYFLRTYFTEPPPEKIGYVCWRSSPDPLESVQQYIHNGRFRPPPPRKLLAIATVVGQYETPFYDKTPSHTSVLTGSPLVIVMWKNFYPPKNHQRILDVFRMPLAIFLALRDWCVDHDYLVTSNRCGICQWKSRLRYFSKSSARTRPTAWHKNDFNKAATQSAASLTKFSTRW